MTLQSPPASSVDQSGRLASPAGALVTLLTVEELRFGDNVLPFAVETGIKAGRNLPALSEQRWE